MKWSLQQLYKYNGNPFTFETTYNFKENIVSIDDIIDIEEFHVSGIGQNLYDDRFRFELTITGMMILECARTLVEVPFPVMIQTTEIFDKQVGEDEDVWMIEKNTIDLKDVVWEAILLQKPIRIVSPCSKGLEEK